MFQCPRSTHQWPILPILLEDHNILEHAPLTKHRKEESRLRSPSNYYGINHWVSQRLPTPRRLLYGAPYPALLKHHRSLYIIHVLYICYILYIVIYYTCILYVMYVYDVIMYVCMYVCVCVCMYVCNYVCVYVCMYVCMHVCVCMYVCIS